MQFSKSEPPERRKSLESTRRLVGVPGVEPGTSSLSGTRSNQLSYTPGCVGGGNGIRTRDFQLAKLALYQLSYAPVVFVPGALRPNSRVTPNILEHSCHLLEAEVVRQAHQPVSRRFFFCGPGRAGAHRTLAGG